MSTVVDADEETARGMEPRIIAETEETVLAAWPIPKALLAMLGPFFGSLLEAGNRTRKPSSEG